MILKYLKTSQLNTLEDSNKEEEKLENEENKEENIKIKNMYYDQNSKKIQSEERWKLK